ncbi:hypothetical protein F4824DRAFT_508660 [Ustulina deusta]|nr:hypothetical protein F4824DRAFT_508660 [Ustulina deusta]
MISFDLSNLTPDEQEEVLNGPALPPPPGVVPNFDNPGRWNYWGILTNVLCLTITLAVIGLRAYVKIFCVKKPRIEDYLILLALATYVGTIYCDIWMIRDGVLFAHQWDIRVKQLGKIIYILHIGANLCAVTIMILKAAILLEWIRIFVPPGTRNLFFWTSTILIGLHTTFYIAWVIIENLSCIPHRRIWDLTIPHGKCIDVRLIYLPVAAINLFADIIILLLPQRTIWTLHMTIKKKIGVALVFAIGIFACLSAAIRLHVTLVFYASEDIVFTEGGMYLWALAEMTCLFLVFCVPSIPRMFVDGGLKTRVKTVLSWCSRSTKTGDSDSESSPQLVVANRPRSGAFRPRQETLYSIDSALGPTTEITAGGYDDHTYQGMIGILRTREILTAVTPAAKDLSNTEGTEEGGSEKHPRSMLR